MKQMAQAIRRRAELLVALALVAGSLVSSPVEGAPGGRIVVAVPPFQPLAPSSSDKELGESLSEAMSRGLGVLRGLRVVEPGPLSRAMERQGARWGEAASGALLLAARSLSADVVIDGRFRMEGAMVRLQARIIDLAERQEPRVLEEGPVAISDLFAVQGRLTQAVVKRLGVAASKAEQARIAVAFIRPTDSLVAYAYYARARRQHTLHTKEAYGLAAGLLFQAIGIDSNFALAHQELGLVFMAMNNRWRAAGEFRKAIQLDPSLPEAYKNLGDLFFTSPRRLYGQAIEAYRKAVELDPEYAEAFVALGEVMSAQGRQDEAVAAYQKALALEPDEPRIHFGLGKIYYNEKGLYHEAVAEYQKAIKIDPRYLEAYLNLGELYEEKGLYREAADIYERALQLDPKHPPALYGLAMALERLDRDLAVAAWERYIQVAPEQSSEKDWLDIAKKHLKKLRGNSGERKDE